MNTELLKSKLLEAAFNGSLTHADTSTWENTNIANIADVKGGKRIPAGTSVQKEPTSHVYLRVTDMKNFTIVDDDIRYITDDLYEGIKKYTISEDDLYLTIAGTIGRVGSIPHKYSGMSLTENAVKLTNIKIDRSYLMYYLASYGVQRRISLFVHQLAQPKLSIENIRSIHIQYPSLEEQRKLVAALEEGFTYIDAVASAKQNLSDTAELLRSKILQAAFDGSLTGADYSQSIVSLGDVCDIARGGSPRPIKQFITTREDGVNWIKIGDTEKGGKYINSCKEKIIPEGVKRSRMVHKGDFLLTNSMSFGRPYITNIDGCIHDGWLVISPHENTFDKDFLYYLLSSSYVFAQFSDKASGSTVSNLNIDKVIATTVPMPPLAEQQRIVAKIEELFTQIDKITK